MKHSHVISYDPRFKSAFVELNREWIEKYFAVEATDREQLENLEEAILAPGGEIFFVMEDEQPVGTCAMIPHGQGYELAKMGVAPACQGRGYGDLLMEAAIEWARKKQATEISILSNTKLEPAIRLYKKHGFQVTAMDESHPLYERCNIEMILKL